jgi:hypothetical protein
MIRMRKRGTFASTQIAVNYSSNALRQMGFVRYAVPQDANSMMSMLR